MSGLVRSGEEVQATQAWNEQVQRSKEYRHHMSVKRFYHLDFLKTAGLLLIILAHVSPPAWLFAIRTFDVPMMVILSGILGKIAYERHISNKHGTSLEYILRRCKRIVLPTWIFCFGVFIPISLLVGNHYSLYEILVTHEVGIENKFMSTIPYQLVPYGILTMVGMYTIVGGRRSQIMLAVLSGLVVIIYAVYGIINGQGIISPQEAKYPARLYYLSYGVFVTMILLLITEKKGQKSISQQIGFVYQQIILLDIFVAYYFGRLCSKAFPFDDLDYTIFHCRYMQRWYGCHSAKMYQLVKKTYECA